MSKGAGCAASPLAWLGGRERALPVTVTAGGCEYVDLLATPQAHPEAALEQVILPLAATEQTRGTSRLLGVAVLETMLGHGRHHHPIG